MNARTYETPQACHTLYDVTASPPLQHSIPDVFITRK